MQNLQPISCLKKIISVAVIFTFLVSSLYQNFVYAATVLSPTIITPQIPFFAADLARIEDAFAASLKQKIYIIQDLHCDYNLQLKIKQIIQNISSNNTQEKLLIGIEGNIKNLKPNILTRLHNGKIKNFVMNELVKRGYISGWELVDRNLKNMRFYGVENKIIYDENLRSMGISFAYRKKLDEVYNSLKPIFEFGESRVYSSALMEFEELEAKHNRGEISLADWTQCFNVEGQNHPNLILFQKLEQLKKTLNMREISPEASLVVRQISKYLDKNEQNSLQTARASEGFYEYLKDLLRAKNIRIDENYSQLAQYFYYLDLKDQINMLQLVNELGRAAYEKKLKIAGKNEAMKKLIYAERYLKIFEAYINNEASASQVEDWQSESKRFFEVMKDLNPKLSSNHVIENNETKILEAKKNMDKFYELANKRNEIMLRNMLVEMARTNTTKGVLVVGGYHGKVIAEMLRAQGIGYELITPVLNPDDKDHTTKNLRKKVYMNRIQEECKRLKLNVGVKVSENNNGQNTRITTGGLDSRRSLSSTALEKSGGGDGNNDGKIGKVDENVLALSQYPEILTKATNIVSEMKGLTTEEVTAFYKALGKIGKENKQADIEKLDEMLKNYEKRPVRDRFLMLERVERLAEVPVMIVKRGVMGGTKQDIENIMQAQMPDNEKITKLIEKLNNLTSDEETKIAAIEALKKFNSDFLVKETLEQTKNTDFSKNLRKATEIQTYYSENVREAAGKALIEIEIEFKKEILLLKNLRDELVKILTDDKFEADEESKKIAIEASGMFGEAEKDIVDALVKILSNNVGSDIQRYIAKTLKEFVQVKKKLVDALLKFVMMEKFFKDENEGSDVNLKDLVNEALKNFKKVENEIVNILLKVSNDKAGYVLNYTREALRNLLINVVKNNRDSEARKNAVIALGKLGKSDKKVIDVLVDALKSDKDDSVRQHIAKVLGELGNSDKEVIEALVKFLSDEKVDDKYRKSAASTLIELGNSNKEIIELLVKFLSDEKVDDKYRKSAASTLIELGNSNKEVIELLVKFLSDEKVGGYYRIYAVEALGKLGNSDKEVIEALVKFLSDKKVDSEYRRDAAETLGKLGNSDKEVIEALIKFLNDERVIEALVKLVNSKEEMLSIMKLLKSLSEINDEEDSKESMQIAAVKELENRKKVEKTDKEIIEILQKVLTNEKAETGAIKIVAEKLGQIEATNVKLIAQMVRVIASYKFAADNKLDADNKFDTDEDSRILGTEVLEKYDGAEKIIVDILIKFITDEKVGFGIRKFASEALSELVIAKKELVDTLVEFLVRGRFFKDENDGRNIDLKKPIKEALKKLKQAEKKMASVFAKFLNDDKVYNSMYRYSVAETLGSLGNSDKEVIGALVKFLTDENEWSVAKEEFANIRKNEFYYLNSEYNENLDAGIVWANLIYKGWINDKGQIQPKFKTLTSPEDEWLQSSEFFKKFQISPIVHTLQNAYYYRYSAARILGELGNSDKKVIDALVKILNVEKAGVSRRYAAEALGKLGNSDKEVIDALVKILNDEKADNSYRQSAAEALGKLGNSDKEVIDALVNFLNDEKADNSCRDSYQDRYRGGYRKSAAEALGKLGKADKEVIDALVNFLSDRKINGEFRGYAAEALGKLGNSDKKVIDALVNFLDSNCYEAAEALVKLGNFDKKVIDALVKFFLGYICYNGCQQSRPNQYYATGAYVAEALGKLGKTDKEVIDALIKVLIADNDCLNYLKKYAAEALSKLEKSDSEILDVWIINTFKNYKGSGYGKDPVEVVEAFWKFREFDKKVIDVLISALKNNKDGAVQSYAAQALGKFEKADKEVIEALIYALKNTEYGYVGYYAVKALGKLGKVDKEVLEALIYTLKNDKDTNMHQAAAEALGKLGKADKEVLEALVYALKNYSGNARTSATKALGELGKADNEVIEALVYALKNNKSDGSGSYAAEALGKLGKADKEVIEVLIYALKNYSDYICGSSVLQYAAEALGKLGKVDKEVLNVLIDALKNSKVNYARSCAAEALGKLGKADKEIIEALIYALKNHSDADNQVRIFAAEALGKLGKADTLTYALDLCCTLPEQMLIVSALVNLGQSNQRSIEILLYYFQDRGRDSNIRINAGELLSKISKTDKKIIDVCIYACIRVLEENNDSCGTVQQSAAKILGNLDLEKADKKALEALTYALKNYKFAYALDNKTALDKLHKIELQQNQQVQFVGLRQGAKMLQKLATITTPFIEAHQALRETLSKKLPKEIQDIKFLSPTVDKNCFIGIIDGNLVMTTDVAEKLENIEKIDLVLFDKLTTEIISFEKNILNSLSFAPQHEFTYESALEAEHAVVASETNTKLLKAFRNLLEYERDLTEHRLTMTATVFQDVWQNLQILTDANANADDQAHPEKLLKILKKFENLNKAYEQLKAENGVLRREVIIPVDEKIGDIMQKLNSLNCLDKTGKIREDVQVTFIGDLSLENTKKLKSFVGAQNIKWVIGKNSIERLMAGDKDLIELIENRIAVEMQVRNNGEILIDTGFVGTEMKKKYDQILDKMTDGNRRVCDRASDMAEITNGMLRVLARMAANGISVEDVKLLSNEKLIEFLQNKLSQIVHGQYNVTTVAGVIRQAIELHFSANGILNTSAEAKFSSDKIRQVSGAEILGIIKTMKNENYSALRSSLQNENEANQSRGIKTSDILLTETHVTGFEMNAVIAEGRQLPEEMKNIADIAENMDLRGQVVLKQVEMKGFEKVEYDVKKAVTRVKKVLINCLSKFITTEETLTIMNKLFDEIIEEKTLKMENFVDRIDKMKAVAVAA